MAGSWRPSSVYSSPPSRLLVILTVLPLALATFAFLLQWRGNAHDRSSPDQHEFPGMISRELAASATSSHSKCPGVLSQSPFLVFPYFRNWNFHSVSDLNPKICITTSTSAGLNQILPWIYFHKVVGISSFFLFVEGTAASPNVSRVLKTIPGVKVIHRTRALEEQQAKSRVWNESWLSPFFYKPCNHELFVKQSLNMEMAIVMARAARMDWIIHLDTDELIHPAGSLEYSVPKLLSEISDDVDMVVFTNYESTVERDDVKEPFSEVSLFKKNYAHVTKETYFGNYKEAAHGNSNYFLTYGNGKSAARIIDNLRPNGAHRWSNYIKTPNEITLEEATVLHYTYTKFSDLTSRRNRCGCKPTKEDVKRCFMLDFDRDAFIIASTTTEEEMLTWYREHVVWSDKASVQRLQKKGILTRIYAPMVIVQGLRESGVFSSLIESALKSTEDFNDEEPDSFLSGYRNEVVYDDNVKAAVPPLSPPALSRL